MSRMDHMGGGMAAADDTRWGDALNSGADDARSPDTASGRGSSCWAAEVAGRLQHRQVNVAGVERAVSVAAGSILALTGLGRRSVPGVLIALVGGAMIHRGVTGHCYAYQALDIDTANEDGAESHGVEETYERGITIETALTINKSAEELYAFWRDFKNLPRIMSHLESVTVQDGVGRRSHWVAKAPVVAGGRVEWDAELTADEPNRRIAWQSVGGNTVDTAGEVRFEKAPGDRGTEVHVRMVYVPPGGKLGHWVTSLMGKNPKRLVREDLRNFQRIMEIGEIPTTEGQSRGTCTGTGREQHESSWKPLFS